MSGAGTKYHNSSGLNQVLLAVRNAKSASDDDRGVTLFDCSTQYLTSTVLEWGSARLIQQGRASFIITAMEQWLHLVPRD